MTAQARDWAWEQHISGGAKLLLLALAERSDRYGVTYIGQATASAMTGFSAKSVSDNMKRLEHDGLIARFRRTRGNGSRTSDWVVLAPAGLDRGRMEDHPEDTRPEAVLIMARRGGLDEDSSPNDSSAHNMNFLGGPEPKEEPTERGERTPARMNRPPRIAGKPVDPDSWLKTLETLDSFNELSGKHLAAVTGTGEPSESAKRIYGRVRAFPDLTLEQLRDVIGRTLKSKWWGAGEPSVGVVFGPKVFEDNLTRSAAPSGRTARDQRDEERRARNQRGLDAIDRLAADKGITL